MARMESLSAEGNDFATLAFVPDSLGNSILHAACRLGSLSTVTNLVQFHGAAVNVLQRKYDNKGKTPLAIAVEYGHVDIVKFLLQRGANVHAMVDTSTGDTLLHLACRRGYYTMVGVLVEAGANVRAKNQNDKTPLDLAIEHNWEDISAYLMLGSAALGVSHAPELDEELLDAIHNGSIDIIRQLIQRGANVNCRNQSGWSPLPLACFHSRSEVVEVILSLGAEVDATMSDGTTSLYIAAENNLPDVAQMLIASGANLNSARTNGATPLFISSQQGHCQVAMVLVVNGANVNVTMRDGSTPLFIACQNGHNDIAELLLENGARVDAALDDGATPLFIACQRGYVNVAESLLANGANPSAVRNDGATAYSIALQEGHVDITKFLVQNSSLGNTVPRGTGRSTPVDTPILASITGNEYDSKSESDVSDTVADYPLHRACGDHEVSVETIQDILDEWPDEVCLPDGEGMLPVHVACRSRASLEVIELLVENWPDSLDWTNSNGSLPLHTACSNRPSLALVEFLVEKWPESTEVRNDCGWLPLHCACAFSAAPEVVRYLVKQYPNGVKTSTYSFSDYAIHLACSSESMSLDVIRCLIESQVDVLELRNGAGELALHKACFNNGPLDVIRFLVDACPSSPLVLDYNGFTPLKHATRQDILEWLVSGQSLRAAKTKTEG